MAISLPFMRNLAGSLNTVENGSGRTVKMDSKLSTSRKALPEQYQSLPMLVMDDSDSFLSMFTSPQTSAADQTLPVPPTTRTKTSSTALFDAADDAASSPDDYVPNAQQKPLQLVAAADDLDARKSTTLPSSPQNTASAMYHRNSDSSSSGSKRSDTSSALSRESSVSSATDWSSSEASAKVSDVEIRTPLKKKGKPKRVSFSDSPAEEIVARPVASNSVKRATSIQVVAKIDRSCSTASVDATSSTPTPLPPRTHRGARLGQAMAGGVTTPSLKRNTIFVLEQSPSPVVSPRNVSNTSIPRRPNSYSFSPKLITFRDMVVADKDTEGVRMSLMADLDDLLDLRNCALVNKSFYRTFKKHEAQIVGKVLFRCSPAAWELRHSVSKLEAPTPFRLKSVNRDMSTLRALQDFILMRCRSICRPQTIDALVGSDRAHRSELEDALWRIWTFCNLFGTTSKCIDASSRQLQWLKGSQNKAQHRRNSSFGVGNGEGLNTKQLEDISEMWRCLEMLLSGFKGHEAAARRAGLFEKYNGQPVYSDQEMLEAWIHDLLALGPKAVLTLSSCDFDQAKVLGVLRWSPPARDKRRTTFLKAAVEEVYRERLMTEARQRATTFRQSIHEGQRTGFSDSTNAPQLVAPAQFLPEPNAAAAIPERSGLRQIQIPFNQAEERQMPVLEIRPDCDPESDFEIEQVPAMSPSSNPTVFSPLAMTTNASTRMGATLFPTTTSKQLKHRSAPDVIQTTDIADSLAASLEPEVLDPADKAMKLLTEELGFSEPKARRALAMADTGSGFDVEKAIDLLSVESKGMLPSVPENPAELPAYTPKKSVARRSSKKDLCEGTCTRRVVMFEPKKDRVTGLGMVRREMSARMSFRKSARLSVIHDEEEVATTTTPTISNDTPAAEAIKVPPRHPLHGIPKPNVLPDVPLASGALLGPNDLKPLPEPPNIFLLKEALLPETTSPVSPITPTLSSCNMLWAGDNIDAAPVPPSSNAQRDESEDLLALPAIPRVTLTRVGTVGTKRTWSLRGKKKTNDPKSPGAIIGYEW